MFQLWNCAVLTIIRKKKKKNFQIKTDRCKLIPSVYACFYIDFLLFNLKMKTFYVNNNQENIKPSLIINNK